MNSTRELLIFSIVASLAAAICLLSMVELALTVRRRRIAERLHGQLKDFKASYNETINRLVLEQDADSAPKPEQESQSAVPTEDRAAIEEEVKKKYEGLEEKNRKALENARARAKKLEDEAKHQADDYLSSRKKEIEEELMGLVISVSKKVLPEGISYDAHKELVMQALREVKTGDN